MYKCNLNIMPAADKIINISVILSSKLITSADLPPLAAGASHHNNPGHAQAGTQETTGETLRVVIIP